LLVLVPVPVQEPRLVLPAREQVLPFQAQGQGQA